jgi:hypothetical protein
MNTQLGESLVEKLNEWGQSEHTIEIIVDCFLSAMKAEGANSDDQLKVLDDAINYFKEGPIKERLVYEATAIKVNYGY